jgi:cell division protease FtsH
MVVDFGMSSLGPVNFGPQYEMGEFGQTEWYEPPQVSQSMQEKVDLEVKRLIDEGYKKAVKLVKANTKTLDKVVKALLEKETLDRDEFEKVVGKK